MRLRIRYLYIILKKEDTEQYTLQDSVKAGIYENLVIDFSKLDI